VTLLWIYQHLGTSEDLDLVCAQHFFGVLSKSTLHEVALNCLVPNVPNSFLGVVPWQVPMVVELLKFIAYDDHMSAGDV
jgi:hypothetical protein